MRRAFSKKRCFGCELGTFSFCVAASSLGRMRNGAQLPPAPARRPRSHGAHRAATLRAGRGRGMLDARTCRRALATVKKSPRRLLRPSSSPLLPMVVFSISVVQSLHGHVSFPPGRAQFSPARVYSSRGRILFPRHIFSARARWCSAFPASSPCAKPLPLARRALRGLRGGALQLSIAL